MNKLVLGPFFYFFPFRVNNQNNLIKNSKKIKMRNISHIIFFLILLVGNLNARNYYVSTTGNDKDAGTYSSPFATIAHAYSLTDPGDSIIVASGTYHETVYRGEVCFKFGNNGTVSNPIVIKSAIKGGAVLDGQLDPIHKYVVAISGDYNILSGFNVKNGNFFGITVQGNHNTVTFCEIDSNGNVANPTTNGQGGIFEGNGGYRGTYIYNYIHHNGRTPGVGDHGIYIVSDSVLIAYNIITYNSNAGVNTKGTHTFIYNNTFAHNGHGIGMSDEDTCYVDGVVIRNNIFYQNNSAGYDNFFGEGYAIHDAADYLAHGGREPVVIKNNLFSEVDQSHNWDMWLSNSWGKNWYTQYGYWDTSRVYEYYSPLFVDDGTNYNLLNSNSPALDNAFDWQTSWEITQDYAGNPRNGNNWDIGAFEYLITNLNLKAFIQSRTNPVTGQMIPDTVACVIKNGSAPFATVDSIKVFLDANGQGTALFSKAMLNTNYYIKLNHRNSIETWSNMVTFVNSTPTYDFTSFQSQAYGNNLVLVGSKWCLYSGDVDQDGFVTGYDYTGIDNDASKGKYNLVNDLNGDGLVTSIDFKFIEENSSLGINRQVPYWTPSFEPYVLLNILSDGKLQLTK